MNCFKRCKVTEIIDKKSIRVRFDDEPSDRLISLDVSNSYLTDCVWQGVTLNVSSDRIIVQPDYLIDISSIAKCFAENGPHALHYIFGLVIPSMPNPYSLLGNTVNLFFDNRVQGSKTTYMECLLKTFHDDAIQYLSIEEEDLRKVYFNNIADQYANVVNVVDHQFNEQTPPLHKEVGLLEPSFICPDLGISGRMDYLEFHNANEASIIELKSGKLDEWRKCSKSSHLIQTLLYAEVLHYNRGIGYDRIHNYLLYNKYPLLSKEQYCRTFVDKALQIRNQIIGYLHQIATGKGHSLFTPETVNAMYCGYNKLWDEYTKPELIENIKIITEAQPALKEWFFEQMQFILREEEITRLGEEGSVCNDRAFSNIWLNSYCQKCADGKIISPMTIESLTTGEVGEVTGIVFSIINDDDFTSHDFRVGDSVMIYPIDNVETKANSRIIMRGNITAIEDESLSVELRNSERSVHFENIHGVSFACEHDIINSSTALSCRALFQMLKAPKRWHELLIEDKTPQAIDYKEEDVPFIDNLVGRMLASKDYFVLVGPPGTGKTSIVLRKLITRLFEETSENILLLSFTHRAVDEICSTLEDIIGSDNAFLDYCRLGSEFDCNDHRFTRHLLSHHIDTCKKRSELLQKIHEMRIFVSTTSRLIINHSLLNLKKFDTIIVDESSQILDYQFIELLTNAKRFILIGDHKQLPAVTLQQSKNKLLFERLYDNNLTKNPSVVGHLIHQGRMHPEIAKFANSMFYGDKLKPIPLSHQLETEAPMPRYFFLDVKPDSEECHSNQSTKCNVAEARKVGDLVKRIFDIYHEKKIEINAKTLGIIVPYRNQISAIRKELALRNVGHSELINIDTAERYQGSQRDIIIFTATVSTPNQLKQLSAPVMIEGQMIDRKLNVIITRARKHLFIVGNRQLLCDNPIYRELIEKMS